MRLMDSPREECFDRLTRLATRLTGAPVALLTLVDADRQFFLSEAGLGEPWATLRYAPLTHGLCPRVVADRSPVVVADVHHPKPGHAPPPAAGDLGEAAFAGVPLIVGGECVGSLSVLDGRPREWTDEQLAALEDVAAMATGELSLRATATERDEALEALRESEERMRLAFEAGAIGMVMTSLEPESLGRMVRVNNAFCEFLGRSEASLLGTHVLDITHPDDRDLSAAKLRELAAEGSYAVRHLEKRYVHGDGHTVWGALTTTATLASGGRRSYVISLVEDITDRRLAENDLPAIANVLRRILSGEDARETIVEAAVTIAGATSAHLVERTGPDMLEVTAVVGADVGRVEIPISARSVTAHVYLTGEPLFLADPAQSPLVSHRHLALTNPASMLWQPILSHDQVIGVLVVCWAERLASLSGRAASAVALLTDETAVALAHLDALERLAAQATTDELTGLPNRRAWDERFAHNMALADRGEHALTLALVDMDRFKHFNDTRGHGAGDTLLREFAEGAAASLRATDTLARLGGEEFGLLLPNCPAGVSALALVERVRAAVPAGQSCSVGFATWDGLETAGQLIGRADRALYRAKASGRDRAVEAAPASAAASGPAQAKAS
jgi:diguanylate cyclase (GGDEF)-like protein/PAS domain S-box-containing protein